MKMGSALTVVIRDWNVPCYIGVYDKEKQDRQNVRVDVDITLDKAVDPRDLNDNFDPDQMFCYGTYIDNVEKMLQERGHIDLLETLVPLLAKVAFEHKLTEYVRVKAIKTDIIDNADVGIEMEFQR